MTYEIKEVIHRIKNLFCNVTHICNLVQEFNGLVSKGSIERLALFTFLTTILASILSKNFFLILLFNFYFIFQFNFQKPELKFYL